MGGGLAGLALGILLRKHDVAVELFESHRYPHHRVCGEFISGLRPELAKQLGILDLAEDAQWHDQTAWHDAQGNIFYQLKLKAAAMGISRYKLDERLATRFLEMGGSLNHQRWREHDRYERIIYATGRNHGQRKQKSKWIGLKLHARNFHSDSDLEMHLGNGGYVGTSGIENGTTNLCGLFPAKVFQTGTAKKNFEFGLTALGLDHLRDRLSSCEIVAGSRCGTMYFNPGYQPHEKTKCDLGDSMMQIPPFTGHGMTMALESAWISHTHILSYVHGETTWSEMVQSIRTAVKRQHSLRLKAACMLHPLMVQGKLPLYWKYLGLLLNPLPPKIAPALWGGALQPKTT